MVVVRFIGAMSATGQGDVEWDYQRRRMAVRQDVGRYLPLVGISLTATVSASPMCFSAWANGAEEVLMTSLHSSRRYRVCTAVPASGPFLDGTGGFITITPAMPKARTLLLLLAGFLTLQFLSRAHRVRLRRLFGMAGEGGKAKEAAPSSRLRMSRAGG